MSDVCNSCGANTPEAGIVVCQYCPTLVCTRCKSFHENVCETTHKMRRQGQGPTVRDGGLNARLTSRQRFQSDVKEVGGYDNFMPPKPR